MKLCDLRSNSVNCNSSYHGISSKKILGTYLQQYTIHLFIFHISPKPCRAESFEQLRKYKKDIWSLCLKQCCTLCCLFHLHSIGAESFPSLSDFNNTSRSCPFRLRSGIKGRQVLTLPSHQTRLAECTRYFLIGVASTIVSFKVFRPLLQQIELIITAWTIATLFRPIYKQ